MTGDTLVIQDTEKLTVKELLQQLVIRNGSDLHLSTGTPPRFRINGSLVELEQEAVTPEESKRLIYSILKPEQIAKVEKHLDLDLSVGFEDIGRFRTNVFWQRGSLGAVLRAIPTRIRDFEELGLPERVCKHLCNLPRGLILVTGCTGSGKSTTLASMVEYINNTRAEHIVTVEDPIEFIHTNNMCHVNQREVGSDTRSFGNALRAVLRQDPDVVLIGEMRDLETIEAALTISETGHLTFATLHTSDAVQTVNRIVDVFPSDQQQQIRTQLSFTLQAVFSQTLLEEKSGKGRALACEILIANSAVRSLIRESKAHQLYSVVQTNTQIGMRTMNQSLAFLVKAGRISAELAMNQSGAPDELARMLQ